jgi:hypothetical protein
LDGIIQVMLWIQSAFFSFSFAWQFSKPSPTCYLGPPPNPLPPTDLCTPKTFPLSGPHLCRWQDYNKNTVLWNTLWSDYFFLKLKSRQYMVTLPFTYYRIS